MRHSVTYVASRRQVTRADGHGSIANANEVTVTKEDGSIESIKTRNILIATGSEVTPFPGIEVGVPETP